MYGYLVIVNGYAQDARSCLRNGEKGTAATHVASGNTSKSFIKLFKKVSQSGNQGIFNVVQNQVPSGTMNNMMMNQPLVQNTQQLNQNSPGQISSNPFAQQSNQLVQPSNPFAQQSNPFAQSSNNQPINIPYQNQNQGLISNQNQNMFQTQNPFQNQGIFPNQNINHQSTSPFAQQCLPPLNQLNPLN